MIRLIVFLLSHILITSFLLFTLHIKSRVPWAWVDRYDYKLDLNSKVLVLRVYNGRDIKLQTTNQAIELRSSDAKAITS